MTAISDNVSDLAARDGYWMRRALRLAAASLGMPAPNPGVGSVIVRDDVELGAGRHQEYGGPHAEIVALADCRARGNDPRGATAYVTLAPCTRHGRTPPCADALIAAGVQRVVWAVDDPNQDAAQHYFAQAGIETLSGVEKAWAQHIHGGFLKRIATGAPRVTGKWAMTLDGRIAAVDAAGDGRRIAISGPAAVAMMRRRRRAFDAIVIGAGTARIDDPRLLSVGGRHPRRVVISADARLDIKSHLVATVDQAPVWVLHDERASGENIARLTACGVQCMAVADAHDPALCMRALAAAGCNDVMVEGGGRVHGAFLADGVYDRLECYWQPLTFVRGVAVAEELMRSTTRRWQWELTPYLIGDTVVGRLVAGAS